MDLRRYLRLKPYVGMVRRMDITPVQTARGWRDDAKLHDRVPAFDEFADLAKEARARLLPHHTRYVEEVSNATHAASIELAVFLDVFCSVGRPAAVADLGSGFSSFVLRSYATRSDGDVSVWSVDDHPGWLEKTRNYLSEKGVGAEQVFVWNDFLPHVGAGNLDLVLHDMGRMEFRAETLERVLTLTRAGGHVILDDVHKGPYRKHVHKVLEEKGLEWLSLKKLTCDGWARYAYLVFT